MGKPATKQRRTKKEKKPFLHVRSKISLLNAKKAEQKAIDMGWNHAKRVAFFKKRCFQPAALTAVLAEVGKRAQNNHDKFAGDDKKGSILPRLSSTAKLLVNNAVQAYVHEVAGRASLSQKIAGKFAKTRSGKRSGSSTPRVSGKLVDVAAKSIGKELGLAAPHARLFVGPPADASSKTEVVPA